MAEFTDRELSQQEEHCLRLLERSKQPVQVKEHCKRVAGLAEKLAFMLNAYGYALDVSLCFRAGLLHDIYRTEPKHSYRGMEFLMKLGLEAEAEICGKHMGEGIIPDEVTEVNVVCLADKIVGPEGTIITTEERFAPGIERYRRENPEVLPSIMERLQTCVKLEENISAIFGCKLKDIL